MTIDPETGLFNTYDVIPLQTKFKMFLSPRLGIAHPISTVAKIFFNYGHMYQWESIWNRYRIEYQTKNGNRIEEFYQPWIDPPRTIAYELGYEHNLFNKMSLRLTGYYKDVNNEPTEVRFYPIEGYRIEINMPGRFRDIRGIEAFLELRRGALPYFSGWASFNWMSSSSGNFGYDRYYEDPNQQPRPVSVEVSQPDIRPIIRLNLDFHTPKRFGPSIGENFSLFGGIDASLLYYWRRGAQFTWNPAGIPLVENNLRYTPYTRWDFRFTKELFSKGSFRSVFYIDIRNLFNNKNMNKPSGGLQDVQVEGHYDDFGWDGNQWWKTERRDYMESLGYTAENEQPDGSFVNTIGRPGDWKDERIDLPAWTSWTFLEKRDIWFGFKVYF